MRGIFMKLLVFMVAFCVVISFSACATKEQPGSKKAEEQSKTEVPKAEAQKSEPEKKIRIGMTVLELANPFFVALSDGARKYATENGAEINC